MPPWIHFRNRFQRNISSICEKILKTTKQPSENRRLFSDNDCHHIAETMKSEDIFRLSCSNKKGSQMIQEVIHLMKPSRIEQISLLYLKSLSKVFWNEYSCHVLKVLLKKWKPLEQATEMYGKEHFASLVRCSAPARVFISLSEQSERFRNWSMDYFRANFLELLEEPEAMTYLSKLIDLSKKEVEFLFVIRSLQNNPAMICMPLVRKILIKAVEKCELKTAKLLYLLVKKEIGWLIGDRYGSHVLRAFLEREVLTVVNDSIEESLRCKRRLIMCKYTRLMVFWLLKGRRGSFGQAMLTTLMGDRFALEEMFAKNINTNLLLLALLAVEDRDVLRRFDRVYQRLKLTRLRYSARFEKSLMHFDSCYQQLLGT